MDWKEGKTGLIDLSKEEAIWLPTMVKAALYSI